MVRLTSITTRTGDDGQTSLADGTRVSKADARIVAQGSVDELNAAVGLAAAMGAAGVAGLLQRIQNDLFDLGADITVPDSAKTEQSLRMTARHIEALEQAVAEVNGRLQPLSSFVLPGGTPTAKGWSDIMLVHYLSAGLTEDGDARSGGAAPVSGNQSSGSGVAEGSSSGSSSITTATFSRCSASSGARIPCPCPG